MGLNTAKIASHHIEAMYRLLASAEFSDDFRAVLLTAQKEYIDDLRTLKKPAEIFAAQGKCDAIDDLLQLLSAVPTIMETRRR